MDKEQIVRRGGWGFPPLAFHGHVIDQVDADEGLIHLRAAGGAGGTYELLGVTETDEEVIYEVGAEKGSHSVGRQPLGYPFPTIDQELDRLTTEWANAGGERQEFEAWRQGASHDSHTTELRAKLRRRREGAE
jgi:hypothetical protein